MSFAHIIFFILDPTPRWNTHRDSPEMRPYNSLPRGQDVNNYPSLAAHQTTHKTENKDKGTAVVTSHKHVTTIRHSPARRAHSEDVYPERRTESTQTEVGHQSTQDSMDIQKGEWEKQIFFL